ncbi:universal stress protein [Hymenobacter busanensis]|uniref:Universal stress protein n=1 Tax=Hymenobacter busanensis TaxID=2607656 RepID=A0A7L4ZWA9_9BACT|nr:universal stress protein [Hymenobacter busanensis]KAA9339753.1 universal stress protein [Hymenobacter busanensis]QHJ06492.1 universal stress protein [Hymenobacter busanensis]
MLPSWPARVVLLHVYQAPDTYSETGIMPGSVPYYDREQITYALHRQAESMAMPTAVEVVTGPFGEALEAAVQRFKPLLVVVGLTSVEGYVETLLANRALPWLRTSPVPAVLVPEGAALVAPRRVLVGIDGEGFAVPATAAASFQELLTTWKAHPVLTYATTPGSSLSRTEVLQSVRHSGLLPTDMEISFQQPLADTPEKGLLGAVDEQRANLLVLLARRRSLFGALVHRSVTARVLRKATVPVLLPVGERVDAAVPA